MMIPSNKVALEVVRKGISGVVMNPAFRQAATTLGELIIDSAAKVVAEIIFETQTQKENKE